MSRANRSLFAGIGLATVAILAITLITGINVASDNAAGGKTPMNAPQGDYVNVEIRGTLAARMMAIGGETTGTEITAGDITWELDLGGDAKLAAAAERLDGRKVLVTGTLTKKQGVERGTRWIVRVDSLKDG
ncbi:MAG: hypothetical protein ACOY3P_12200 [Planctomycetota bacterium]